MSEKKWDKISVKEICTTAGITRGTFYQYYNDIYDLMESLQQSLLTDISERFAKIKLQPYSSIPPDYFIEKFDYSPPAFMPEWYLFCRDHKKAMYALLDRKKGDTFFVKQLKKILTECFHYMMDCDGLPRDRLRDHYIKSMTEICFLTTQTWLEDDAEDSLTIPDIVNLLNVTRVGACYLTYKGRVDPDFEKKMSLACNEKI